MARLIISSPAGKRGILELTRPVISVGRGAANDLVLNDPSVSRLHAVLRVESGAVLVADRGSTNGVQVNGATIAEDTALRDGDRIRIGVYTMKFEGTLDESALVVHKAHMPRGVDQVLKGEPLPLSRKMDRAPVGTIAELAGQVKRLERENYLLTVLYDAGKALASKLSIEDIAEHVLSFAFRIHGVERGFMMLFNDRGEIAHQTEVRYRTPPEDEDAARIILSQTLIERLKQEPEPILITDAAADERFKSSESLKISGLRSAMIAPLLGPGSKALGILYVDNMQEASAFTRDELNVFALVATQAAAAIDNARSHQQLAEHAVQRSALERFLSPEVVELIAANPNNIRLGGTNQDVSVMFADIRGFTEISDRLAPERVVEILNEYFTRATDIIFDHGGTLDKYLGDGVMALFGAPLSKGNDAAHAVKAAIALQQTVEQLNRDATARGWPELRVGIGINSGPAIAGNIGSPRRIDYTVIGDTVNVAARLMTHALGGQILIARDTAQQLDNSFNIAALRPIQAKGKSQPIPVYAVRWTPAHRSSGSAKAAKAAKK